MHDRPRLDLDHQAASDHRPGDRGAAALARPVTVSSAFTTAVPHPTSTGTPIAGVVPRVVGKQG
jgi:hypothetical protein